MERINIEIKAKCTELGRIRQILRARDANFIGEDHQIDTYFRSPNGRLKLREGNIENNLIFYERSNEQKPKASHFVLYKPTSNEVLKGILAKSLGVLCVIDKLREIYYIDNIKFHLDCVKNIGTFVEIEATGTCETDRTILLEQCRQYVELFEIEEHDLISESYSDMVLPKKLGH